MVRLSRNVPSSFSPPPELGDDHPQSPGAPGASRDELKAVCLLSAGVQRVDEGGWNTVQGTKNSRVLDPTKFLKITKVGDSTGLTQSNKVPGCISLSYQEEF